jgi:hypothetical protein
MAFEAILSQQQARPSGKFGSLKVWVTTFVILLHAVGLAFLIVQSIWHVDELPMPAIEVTLSVAPPPPPPPPPPPQALLQHQAENQADREAQGDHRTEGDSEG